MSGRQFQSHFVGVAVADLDPTASEPITTGHFVAGHEPFPSHGSCLN